MQHQGRERKEGKQSEDLAILKGLCTKVRLPFFLHPEGLTFMQPEGAAPRNELASSSI